MAHCSKQVESDRPTHLVHPLFQLLKACLPFAALYLYAVLHPLPLCLLCLLLLLPPPPLLLCAALVLLRLAVQRLSQLVRQARRCINSPWSR